MAGNLPADEANDEDLMLRIQQGHISALEPLYDRHARTLMGYLFNTVRDRQAAQDLLHDAFVRLVEQAKAYQHPRPLRPWLYTIARNLAFNFLQKARPSLSLDSPDKEGESMIDSVPSPEGSPEDEIMNSERKTALKRALDQLNPEERDILLLRLAQDLSYQEISSALGVSQDAIRQRMSRAIKRLRQIMDSSRNS